MAEDQWVQLIQTQQQFLAKMEQELAQSMFGRQLPFVRIPPGTVALPWTQLDHWDIYEIDLTANDEASVRLAGLYPIEEAGKSALERAKILKIEDNRATLIAHQIGGLSELAINPIDDGTLAFNLAVRFQIIAENLTDEIHEIFHVEIPMSYDNIICNKYQKRSKEYKKLEKQFEL